MINQPENNIMVATEAIGKLPFWEKLTDYEKEQLHNSVTVQSFTKGELISSCDASCLGMVLLLKGRVRVYIVSDDGREITLFRLNKDESCVTTASCVIQQLTFETVVIAEEDTEMLVIPSSFLYSLAEENIYVKAKMFELLTERFSTVMWVMQQVLFKRFDQRLAEFFVTYYEKTGTQELRMTQEEIAVNVNSAREVVTRMLRQFSADGLISVERGRIILIDVDALRKLR